MEFEKDLQFYKIMKLLDFLKFEDDIKIYFGSIICNDGKAYNGLIKIPNDKQTIIILHNFVSENVIFANEIKNCVYKYISDEEKKEMIKDLENRLEKL